MQNIPKNMFEPAAANAGDAEKISKKSLSLWKDAMLRFRSNKLAMVGLIIIVLIILMAIFAPMFSRYDYSTTNLLNADKPPSKDHWFGTDDLGRDIFVRTWVGALYRCCSCCSRFADRRHLGEHFRLPRRKNR